MTTPIYGPEPWRTKRDAVWSYWDLWFCVVAVADHDGDPDALAAAIEDGGRSSGSGTVEAKLSHLDDLRLRLTAAGTDAAKLPGDADADPRVRGKARAKVLTQGLYPRDLTDAMRRPPRDRLYQRALRGRWNLFPVSPEPFYERLANRFGEGYRSKGQTFALERRSTPRASGLTATPPRIPRRGSPPDGHCSRSATGRWSAATTPTA